MKKLIFLSIIISVIGAGLALSGHAVAQSSRCVSLNTNLHVGSTDSATNSQVSILQNYLVARGYLVMPTGVSTGYFGQLTLRAVSTFQVANNITPSVGFVGPITRAQIVALTCVATSPSSPNPAQCEHAQPPAGCQWNIGDPNTCEDDALSCPNHQTVTPHIDSISPSQITARNPNSGGSFSASFTIRGSNFTSTGNEILMNGNHFLSNVSSSGSSLSFTISEHCDGTSACSSDSSMLFSPGTYAFSVRDAGGTSNSVNVRVTENQQTSSSHINSISPTSGPTGTQITIYGSGFTSNDNTINFGSGIGSRYPNFTSSDGRTIVFTVPARDNPMCPDSRPCPLRAPDPISPGVYEMNVSNTNGTSNSVNFTVTSN